MFAGSVTCLSVDAMAKARANDAKNNKGRGMYNTRITMDHTANNGTTTTQPTLSRPSSS